MDFREGGLPAADIQRRKPIQSRQKAFIRVAEVDGELKRLELRPCGLGVPDDIMYDIIRINLYFTREK